MGVFAVYAALSGRLRLQNAALLVASLCFYSWGEWRNLPYLLGIAGIDYAAGLAIERWPARRKRALVASILGNLGVLAWFKYSGFFAANVAAMFHVQRAEATALALPVGISFYTFQSLGYTVDVYRGQLRARRDPLEYLLFVSFFPQLVAGPIERAGRLLAQIEAPRTITLAGVRSGLCLIAWGAFKKLGVADTIAPYVDRVFGLTQPGIVLALVGSLAFSLQILADFSGYTDIARGVARLFGFELVPNFLRPYLAASPSELWRRWHVSFSAWIRDYVYIPLGGSLGSAARVAAATLVAMALSGLWHGASWNFVAWGVFHGCALVAWRRFGPGPARLVRPLPRLAGMAATFGITLVGWYLFRQRDLSVLATVLASPFPRGSAELTVSAAVLAVTGLVALPQLVALPVERWLLPRLGGAPRAIAEAAFLSTVTTLLVYLTHDGVDAFIYFRF